jgi:hypothetical protein
MSSTQQLLLGEGAGGAAPVYIEEVFNTTVYTGNGTSQNITNGIDLSTKGGLVWTKTRAADDHCLVDTARGNTKMLYTNGAGAQLTYTNQITSFNTNGYSIADQGYVNNVSSNYVSWTFREQPKFFDVVTWTGNGANYRAISHSLGSTPGCVIVKSTSASGSWAVWHRSADPKNLILNSTLGSITGQFSIQDVGATTFAVANSSFYGFPQSIPVNDNGATYVAYLFAHDAGGFGLTGTDNVISCGTYTGTGAPFNVSIGYEPQMVLTKASSTTGNWYIFDNMRGMPVSTLFGTPWLLPNSSAAESDGQGPTCRVTSTGFTVDSDVGASGVTYVYIAIRRGPMKVPTTGSSVFAPVTYTGTNVDNRLVDTGILTDMTMARIRTSVSTGGFYVADRLRNTASSGTALTGAESTDADSFMSPTSGFNNAFTAMNGFGVGNDVTRQLNGNSTSQLAHAFKRAAGFFDVVCYTGNGVDDRSITHNLTVVPEFVIVRRRETGATNWAVYHKDSANGLALNLSDAAIYNYYYLAGFTTTTFGIRNSTALNASNETYVSYLFATVAGVSKVGSYTGTAALQTVNCNFTTGARYVLIKRTDSAGEWYVWDTARGMTSGNDPYLRPNTNDSETTGTNYVDTTSTGFQVTAAASTTVNISGGTFIFLAIA